MINEKYTPKGYTLEELVALIKDFKGVGITVTHPSFFLICNGVSLLYRQKKDGLYYLTYQLELKRICGSMN